MCLWLSSDEAARACKTMYRIDEQQITDDGRARGGEGGIISVFWVVSDIVYLYSDGP